MAWGELLKLGRSIFKPAVDFFYRRGRFADSELNGLRDQAEKLLDHLIQSGVSAQLAVRGSPNEQRAQDESFKAIECSTRVGQQLAGLLNSQSIAAVVPPGLQEARRRYREVVADEANLDIIDVQERTLRCEEIENATADLQREIEVYVFARWGIGLRMKAGRMQDRKLPK